MPPRFWRSGWKKAPWMRALFGRIYAPSTASSFVAEWLHFWPDTPVNPLARPASDVVQTIRGIYGPTLLASLAKSGRHFAFSRTCRDTFLWGSERSPETLNRWATKLRRACLRRRKSVQATSGSGCSSLLWPTAQTVDCKETPQPLRKKVDRQTRNETPGSYRGDLADHAAMWSTPRAEERQQQNSQDSGEALSRQAGLLATPNARDHKGCDLPSRNGGASLAHQVQTGEMTHSLFSLPAPATPSNGAVSSNDGPGSPRLWQTPNVPNGGGKKRGGKRGDETLLPGQVEEVMTLWRTPATSDTGTTPAKLTTKEGDPAKIGARMYRDGKDGERINQTQSLGLQVAVIGGAAKKLNPLFCEWLMGWPIGWTDCGQSVTVASLNVWQCHSFNCLRRYMEIVSNASQANTTGRPL